MRDLLATGQRQTRDTFAYGNYEGHIFNAVALAGAGGIVPAPAAAVIAASLPRIETAAMPAGVRRVTLSAGSAPKSTSTCIGWYAAVNQGGQANAKVALDKVINSTGGNLLQYGVTMTPAAEDDNIVFVPSSGEIKTIDLELDLVDIFFLPISSAATKVGIATLNIIMGVPLPIE